MSKLRKMSGAEVALARYASNEGSWRVGAFVSLKGERANDDEKLAEVLSKVQRRHPLLRVVMTVKGRSISWKDDPNYRIPLIVTEGDKFEAYCKYTQQSLKSGDGIMRCVLVKNEAEQTSTLIPLLDHFASDGMSYTNLIKEILWGWTDSPEFEKLDFDLPVPESCEAYANRSYKGQYLKKLSVEAQIVPRVFGGSTYTKKPKKEEPKDGEPQLFHFDELSPEDTKLVLKACRNHGTTITGLVGAVFAEVYSKVVHERAVKQGSVSAEKDKSYSVSQSLAFDLRRLYKPSIKREGISFHVGFGMPIVLSSSATKPEDEKTWKNAKTYKEKLSKDQTSGTTLATALLASVGVPLILGSPLKFCDLFFTNWGLIPFKTEYDGLEITDFVGGINSIHIPFPIIIASSFKRKLGFTIQAPRKLFDEAFIKDFHRGILGRIEALARAEQ